jgi:hypothetical protein
MADSSAVIVTGHRDGSVRVWDLVLDKARQRAGNRLNESWRLVKRDESHGHKTAVTALHVSDNSGAILSGDQSGMAMVFMADPTSLAMNRVGYDLPADQQPKMRQFPCESCGSVPKERPLRWYWCSVLGCGDLLCSECRLAHLRNKHPFVHEPLDAKEMVPELDDPDYARKSMIVAKYTSASDILSSPARPAAGLRHASPRDTAMVAGAAAPALSADAAGGAAEAGATASIANAEATLEAALASAPTAAAAAAAQVAEQAVRPPLSRVPTQQREWVMSPVNDGEEAAPGPEEEEEEQEQEEEEAAGDEEASD